jgi:hypothetical protein
MGVGRWSEFFHAAQIFCARPLTQAECSRHREIAGSSSCANHAQPGNAIAIEAYPRLYHQIELDIRRGMPAPVRVCFNAVDGRTTFPTSSHLDEASASA